MALSPPSSCDHGDQSGLLGAVCQRCQICPASLTPTSRIRPSALVSAATWRSPPSKSVQAPRSALPGLFWARCQT